MSTVEARFLVAGEIDETKYNAFVAKTVATNLRLKAKGHRDYKDVSEADLVAGAESYCRLYREQFRVWA